MNFQFLHYLADVALSRGALSDRRVKSSLTSPAPSIVVDSIERLPPTQRIQHYPSMPHINTYFQQNAQSPPSHSRIPVPTPQTRSTLASPNARRQPQHEELSADLVEQLTALLDRCGFEIRPKTARQQSQS